MIIVNSIICGTQKLLINYTYVNLVKYEEDNCKSSKSMSLEI